MTPVLGFDNTRSKKTFSWVQTKFHVNFYRLLLSLSLNNTQKNLNPYSLLPLCKPSLLQTEQSQLCQTIFLWKCLNAFSSVALCWMWVSSKPPSSLYWDPTAGYSIPDTDSSVLRERIVSPWSAGNILSKAVQVAVGHLCSKFLFLAHSELIRAYLCVLLCFCPNSVHPHFKWKMKFWAAHLKTTQEKYEVGVRNTTS